MTSPLLMDRAASCLLVVDLQTGLLPKIDGAQAVLDNAAWLLRLAGRLDVPVLFAEQYPSGLGATEPSLRALAPQAGCVEKIHFSAAADGCLSGTVLEAARQVIICGTEAHVCVMQTALDLVARGSKVFVVAEAIGSRRPADCELAIERMRMHGIDIVSREMVAFEWLRRAGSETFRDINQALLR
jgi:nicotinamidase-related amidase